MDKDRLKGIGNQAAGAVKKTLGGAVGDEKTKAEGAAQQSKGKVQNAVGGVKDALRQTVKK